MLHINFYIALAGLIVGFTVGLTGMGGGALMTPILVLLFGVQPLAAVSSDLVAAVLMKPVGGAVHWRRGTVNMQLVRWLMIGSIPAAFAGVLVIKQLGHGQVIQDRLKLLLGLALLFATASLLAKAGLEARWAKRRLHLGESGERPPFKIRRVATVLVGIVGGLVVGMTSVGSGSFIIVALLMLYPTIKMREMVGTDLVQAIPLVASAALGHILFGDFKLGLTASLLIGSIPGVYFGARLSSRAPDLVVRPVLAFVLLASGLKLVNVSTVNLGLIMLAVTLVGLPLWAMLDAVVHPIDQWRIAGINRRLTLAWQAIGAPFGVGFVAAIVYFASVRPKLTAAAVEAVAVQTATVVGEHAPV